MGMLKIGNNKDSSAECLLCPNHCKLKEGQSGRCHARKHMAGRIVCSNYGKVTSVALDPIEKKPLARFLPGKKILSLGSYGCNLHCPFCQNFEIACAREDDKDFTRVICDMPRGKYEITTDYMSPKDVVDAAKRCEDRGNVGVAYTYNEPLIGIEYVRDCAKLVHEAGMVNVVVTNGCFELPVLHEILPYIDAMNIDLKSAMAETYSGHLGGDRETVLAFITEAASHCHVEITTLVVPGLNDSPLEIETIAAWIAELNGGKGKEIPLHLTRFFPRHRMKDRDATDVEKLVEFSELAKKHLDYVYIGNV